MGSGAPKEVQPFVPVKDDPNDPLLNFAWPSDQNQITLQEFLQPETPNTAELPCKDFFSELFVTLSQGSDLLSKEVFEEFLKNQYLPNKVKILFLGDRSTGKTSLIHRMLFGEEFTCSSWSSAGYFQMYRFGGHQFYLMVVDALDEDPSLYSATSIVVTTFRAAGRSSMDQIRLKWYPHIQKHIKWPHLEFFVQCCGDLAPKVECYELNSLKKWLLGRSEKNVIYSTSAKKNSFKVANIGEPVLGGCRDFLDHMLDTYWASHPTFSQQPQTKEDASPEASSVEEPALFCLHKELLYTIFTMLPPSSFTRLIYRTNTRNKSFDDPRIWKQWGIQKLGWEITDKELHHPTWQEFYRCCFEDKSEGLKKYYQEGSDKGVHLASFKLCTTLKDRKKILDLLTTAATGGCHQAQYELGVYHERQFNYAQAKKWYILCMVHPDSNSEAVNSLGWFCLEGLGEPMNHSKALHYYKLACEKENARAQCSMGWLYHNGWAVEQSYTEALKWYYISSDNGSLIAHTNIAWCFQDGLGVAVDYDKTFYYYNLAALDNQPDGINGIGWCYQNGFGCKKDLNKAKEYYRSAVAKGNQRAVANLANLGG